MAKNSSPRFTPVTQVRPGDKLSMGTVISVQMNRTHVTYLFDHVIGHGTPSPQRERILNFAEDGETQVMVFESTDLLAFGKAMLDGSRVSATAKEG